MSRYLTTLALGGALLLSASARAEDKAKANAPVDDKDFVTKAVSDGQAEVKLGELAQKNAASDRVKAFGARMVKDHTMANEQLTAAAKNQRIGVVAGLDKEHREHFDMLSKLQGQDFDREYMKMMKKDHTKAVAMFEAEAKNSTDPDLKKFAETTLPTLREHLTEAKSICDELKIKDDGK